MHVLGLVIALLTLMPVLGQSVTPELQSPKQVVEEFTKRDLNGVRLSEKGSHEMSRFFAEPTQPQRDKTIGIVSDKYEVRETELIGDHAKVVCGFFSFYGTLDSAANFEPTPSQVNGVPVKGGAVGTFALVRVGTRQKADPNAEQKTNVEDFREWKIDGPPPNISISRATAIHYLVEISKNDNDPIRRKNAARSLVRPKNIH